MSDKTIFVLLVAIAAVNAAFAFIDIVTGSWRLTSWISVIGIVVPGYAAYKMARNGLA